MAEHVDFYFDIGSPYSYLAATQLDGVAARCGADIRWQPALLGGIFKSTGNRMPAAVPAKMRFMTADLARWAVRYGVPFTFPADLFPLNTLRTMRAVTAATGADRKTFALALFRAFWADSRDVSDPAVIATVGNAAGLDGPALAAASDHQPIKDALRAATEQAVAQGAFGAPTFVWRDALYWGNDRLQMLQDDICGAASSAAAAST